MSEQGGTTWVPKEGAGGTQAISRALSVLDLFRDSRADLGIVQIAAELDLRPSTVHRIVRALVADGYLAQSEQTERYYLGRSALLLGVSAQSNLGLAAALPVLERIGALCEESVNLGVPDGTHALVMLRVESPQPLRFDQPPGTRVPLHASSMGKSLLAFSEDVAGGVSALVDAVGRRLPRYTRKTITSPSALRRELKGVRECGYSVDNEESIPGVRCVGAPILDSGGFARAALAIQAPSIRMSDDRVEELSTDVINAAKEIAGVLPPDHKI